LDEFIDDLRVAAFLASVQSVLPASGVSLERPLMHAHASRSGHSVVQAATPPCLLG